MEKRIEIGIDSFAGIFTDENGIKESGEEAMANVLERIELADKVGLDIFGIGEHHRIEALDSAAAIILAAAAARTKRIRLTSSVIVLSAADPVRVFQNFATLDLISKGRAEMIVGRGSSIEAFPLFGYSLNDYDELFAEKLDLLLKIRDNEFVTWSGKFRPALNNLPVYPRPSQNPLPISLGVGGTPASFVRAGTLGLPLELGVIGGETHRFRPLIDLYKQAGVKAGHPAEKLKVGLHTLGYVANTIEEAITDFYPGYAQTMNSVALERGWPMMTRQRFEAQLGSESALLIGSPEEVAEKIIRQSEVLGGISRVSFQMDVAALPNRKTLQAIELIGTRVSPLIQL